MSTYTERWPHHQGASSVIDELAYHFRGCVFFSKNTPSEMHNPKQIALFGKRERSVLQQLYVLTRNRIRMDLFRASRFSFRLNGPVISDPQPLRFFVPFIFCDPRGKWYSRAPFQIDIERLGKSARVTCSGDAHLGPDREFVGRMTIGYKTLRGSRYTVSRAHVHAPDDKESDMRRSFWYRSPVKKK